MVAWLAEENAVKWLLVCAAVGAGILAALAVFGILAWTTIELVQGRLESHGPSGGAALGWLEVFLAPVLGPLYLIMSIVCGVLTSLLVARRILNDDRAR